MGDKGDKKRKGGGLAKPSFMAGGLRMPSPTPGVGRWETEEKGYGGRPARDSRPKVLRVGDTGSVADVGGVSEETSKLRLSLWDSGMGPDVLTTRVVKAETARNDTVKEYTHWMIRVYKFREENKVVENEIRRLLTEGFDQRGEIERLKEGQMSWGKDRRVGTARLFGMAPVDRIPVGV